MIDYTQIVVAAIGPIGVAGGYLVRRWLATETPFLKTIKHQDAEIESLRKDLSRSRRDLAETEKYIWELVRALRQQGLEVPERLDI